MELLQAGSTLTCSSLERFLLYVVAGFSRPFSVRLKADTTCDWKTL